MNLFRRKRVTIDARIQGGLCLRICVYWCVCLVFAGLLVMTKPVLEGSIPADQLHHVLWVDFIRPLLGTFLVLPLVLLDCLIFGNRLAGPLFRFRHELAKINAGEPARQIQLRSMDFGREVADELNALIERSGATERFSGQTQPDVRDREEQSMLEETLA